MNLWIAPSKKCTTRVFLSGDLKTTSSFLFQIRRALPITLKHLTFKKLFNASVCLFEMVTKRSVLHSDPLYLRIEVCPYCNLRCPGCMLGGTRKVSESNPEHRLEGAMKYILFEESLRDFAPSLFRVWLYDEGEPLLNGEIYDMIHFLSTNNVGTCVSTNFSLKFSDETIGKIADCGLEHLIVALDGSTQESYSRYRRGGDFNLVVSNIRRLQSLLSKKKSSPLKIEIQFLEFEYNKEEREAMRKLAKELGVWRLTIMEGCSCGADEESRPDLPEDERRDKRCYEIWLGATINSIGELGTCDYGEDFGIPNIGFAKDYKSEGLRNHPAIIQLRKSFGDNSVPLNDICKQCHWTIKKR
ncbi:MAG TPA: radical SAM protein [Methanosarcinales archaeon]|nr:radical SAM protein [Methanosarcinales archaeon]